MLSRDHVQKFLLNYNPIYDAIHIGDEYFLNCLHLTENEIIHCNRILTGEDYSHTHTLANDIMDNIYRILDDINSNKIDLISIKELYKQYKRINSSPTTFTSTFYDESLIDRSCYFFRKFDKYDIISI